MNTAYQALAYERTLVIALRRLIEDKYLPGGGGLKEELICEAVPYDIRQVPNETFIEFIQRLQEEERQLTEEMAQYDFRKRESRPLARKPPPEPAPEEGGPPAGGARKARKPRAKPVSAG